MNNDLISRQLVIDAMNEVYCHIKMIKKRSVNKTEQAMYLDMIGAVKSVPTEERPQGEWVSVSERLPEQNGFYITTCRDICENRVHVVMFDGVRKKWGRGGVIAWQPLPEPYKEGEPCSHDCDTCEHGVPIDGQYYDDGTPIHECSIRPTEHSEQESKQYALGYQDGFLDARKKAIADGLARPQAKWEPRQIGGAASFAIVHCSNCGEYGNSHYKFCPNCGAQMKGGVE